MRRLLLIAVVLFTPTPASADDFFEKRIRPILVARCIKCHGEEEAEGQLRLDSRKAILTGGESGPAARPKQPAKSLMLKAVLRTGDLKMPPDGKLQPAEVAALRRWIKQGLPWPPAAKTTVRKKFVITEKDRRHWSFQPVRPPQRLGAVAAWCRTAVDHFIWQKMTGKGLRPARPAARRVLLRRVTYGLTGLPPSPAEVQSFLSDKSPNAYEKVVERLLASPQYGERWGRHWLDVVRYCDSRDARHTGQRYDINEAWRYRDWVVRAFNQDLPYDDFIRLQIAGDCIQQSDPGGVVATGMLVIGEWGSGDADAKKMYTDIVDDQIHVVTQAFLSLSVTCARCHDHKFDPISTKDYYALAGIFFSTQVATPRTDAPLLRRELTGPANLRTREKRQARLAQLKTEEGPLQQRLVEQFLPQTTNYLLALAELERQRSTAIAKVAATAKLDAHVLAEWLRLYRRVANQNVGGPLLTKGVKDFTARGVFAWKSNQPQPLFLINTNSTTVKLPATMPAKSIAVHPRPTTGVGLVWRSPVAGRVTVTGTIADAHNCGNGVKWALELARSNVTRRVSRGQFAAGGKQDIQATALDVGVGDYLRLAVFPKGSHICDMTRLQFRIRETAGKQRSWDVEQDLTTNPEQGNPHQDRYGNSRVWYFVNLDHRSRPDPIPATATSQFVEWLKWIKAARSKSPRDVAAGIQRVVNASLKQPATPLRRFLLSKESPYALALVRETDLSVPQVMRGLLQKLADNRSQQRRLTQLLAGSFPLVLAAREGGVPTTVHAGFNDARIHIRGSYRRLGERVPRAVPAIFGKTTGSVTGSGRVPLANWIASRSNPLTSRVMVNRIWLHHFGRGLVRTPGDFGTRGQPPTHPKLLDYLAWRFVQSGWSIKDLHRQLVLSATYQQSSKASRSLRVDPENRYWSRMEIRRLTCEEIRDSLLAAADSLDLRIGGPSIARYPQGYSRAVYNVPNYRSMRRTLYLMSIRSEKTKGPFVLDAADPDRIVHQRPVTTTSPQALFLLNNDTVLALVRSLAERVESAATNDTARILAAYRFLFSRAPTLTELKLNREFLRRLRSIKIKDGLTVWQSYCHALLCTNEVIYLD